MLEIILHQQYQSYIDNQNELIQALSSIESEIANNEKTSCLVPFTAEAHYKKQLIMEREKLVFCQKNYNEKAYYYRYAYMQELPCASLNNEARQTFNIYQVLIQKEKNSVAIAYIAVPTRKEITAVCKEGVFLTSTLLSIRHL